jgi:hypothetical protein
MGRIEKYVAVLAYKQVPFQAAVELPATPPSMKASLYLLPAAMLLPSYHPLIQLPYSPIGASC